jgi:Tol biopolymer transport system component
MIRTTRFFAIAILATTLTLAQAERSAEVQLKAAMHKEQVEGDLKAAIEQYRQIISHYGKNRAVAAQAIFHMAQCHEKLGQAEARKLFEQLVKDYADQKEIAKLANARLTALSRGLVSNGIVARQVMIDPVTDIYCSLSPDGRFLAYVDWASDGNVGVYDLKTAQTRRLTKEATAAGPAHYADGLAVSPDSKQVAYGWYNEDQFYELRSVALDAAPPRIVYRDKERWHITPFDWSKDGKDILALRSREENDPEQIVIISIQSSSLRAIRSFAKSGPRRMAYSPDGRRIVYDAGGDIAQVSLDTREDTPLVKHPANDFMLGWAPDGKSLLFGSDRTGSRGIWLLRLQGDKAAGEPILIKGDSGEITPIGIAPDGSFFYGVGGWVRNVYRATVDLFAAKVVEPPSPAVQQFMDTNGVPDWSPDGTYLAYGSGRRRSMSPQRPSLLCTRDEKSGEEREFAPELSGFGRVRCLADGRSFLVMGADLAGRRGIYRFDTHSPGIFAVYRETADFPLRTYDVRPEGKRVYYSGIGSKALQIRVRDLQTGDEKVIYTADEKVPAFNDPFGDIAVSPDERWLAFVEEQETPTKLMVISTQGGEARQLMKSDPPQWIENLAWTPDGRYLLYTKRSGTWPHGERTEVFRISAQGGESIKLGISYPRIAHFRIHPDGRRIAFAVPEYRAEIWVMENIFR